MKRSEEKIEAKGGEEETKRDDLRSGEETR